MKYLQGFHSQAFHDYLKLHKIMQLFHKLCQLHEKT